MAKLAVVTESSGFIRNKGSFDGIVKKLTKVSNAAIEMLEKTMEETQDEKLKVACATKLVEFYMAALDKQNTDEITRMISEVKLKGGLSTNLKVATPVIDFSNIQDVS